MAEPPQLPYARDPQKTSSHSALSFQTSNSHHQQNGSQSMSGSHTYDHTRSNGHSIVNGEEEGDDDEDDEDEVMGREADGEDIGHHTAASLQYWTAPRHGKGKGKSRVDEEYLAWRLKTRSKTTNAGMFICLNIGVDPPDVVKTQPCAKMECWLDPTSIPATKAIEAIGRNLHQQFETLNPKVKFRPFLDPSVEDTKKQCIGLRKGAREERTVFYYNGHGVPKPTASGEIWVFNKTYTQYIPVSLYDLQDWLGTPTVYVWECGGAGNILSNFGKAAERKDAEAKAAREAHGASDLPTSSYSDAIHLAACLAGQTLPMSPDLPADLFTCCLTSPIETSLRHFVLQDPLRRNISTSPDDPRSRVTIDMVMRIPGDLKDRRTPLGELNWIFTAVTDTIAWSSFPRDLFNRLFRQDLLVAALFRNFLLAQRIMNTYHCSPISIPELPNTSNHALWHSWDLAVDACLAQLPGLLDQQDALENGLPTPEPPIVYTPSDFFAQHLQAFEVWLDHGGTITKKLTPRPAKGTHRPPPEQLPIVLQVLLSQGHRLRALILLSRFVDLGPWAVHLSLSIGIFPYVQKLLQSPAVELKPVLIFIWARILAVDRSCQVDLLRDQGYEYFARVLYPHATGAGQPLNIPNANEHRAMCAFILSTLCRNFKAGQTACLAIGIFDTCLETLVADDWLLKTWSLLCIAQLWADNDDAKSLFITSSRQAELLDSLRSTSVEVRAASLYAFSTFLGGSSAPASSTEFPGGGGSGAQMQISDMAQLELECGLAFACMMSVKEDASPMVRKELVVVISCVAREWRGWFVCAAWAYYEHEAVTSVGESGVGRGGDIMSSTLEGWISNADRTTDDNARNLTLLSSFKVLFETLLDLSVDPSTEVALMASTVVDYVVALLLDSAFMRVKGSAVQRLTTKRRQALSRQHTGLSQGSGGGATNGHGHPQGNHNGAVPQLRRQNTGISETSSNNSSTLKRNSSFAGGLLKGLATMTGLIADDTSTTTTSATEPTLSPPPPATNGANYTSPYPDHLHPRTLPDMPRASSSASSSGQIHTRLGRTGGGLALSSSAFSEISGTPADPASILEALTEEDMERLRIRRSRGTQAGGDVDGRLGNNGLARSGDLGLGMVAKEVKDDVLPLRSGFYDWAVDYFREPQMKSPDADEPGSTTYNEQAWKHIRNEQLVEKSRQNEEFAAQNSWGEDAGTLHNDAWPLQLAFHSFDPVMAVTDDTDNICIWDWKTRRKINKFSNQNVPGSSISGIHFINEGASSLILTASTEGSIRIWRDYETPGETQLASTFRAVSDLAPAAHSSGVLTAWEQTRGHLLVGGDMRIVRLWDAIMERHVRDIATQAGSNLTAMATDEPDGNVFVAGFGDGVVRLFDKRVEDASAVVVRTWRKHHTWIQSVHLQRGGQRELLTGSMNGEVRIWDVRAPDTPLYESMPQPHGLMSLAVHAGAPVFATTSAPSAHSARQRLVIQGFSNPEEPRTLSTIGIPLAPAHHSASRALMPSAASLVFHPVEMVVAAGGFDSSGTVKLYKCPTPNNKRGSWGQSAAGYT